MSTQKPKTVSRDRARWAYAEWQRECERQRQREAAVRIEEARPNHAR
ncbi:MAG: hypothetical protein WC977_14200 [Anaerovoracaceae bacterium]